MIEKSDVSFKLCRSPNSPFLGAEIGVEATHISSGLIVKSVDQRSQYQNKIHALIQLEKELSKLP